ncbi:hypothetical protein BDP55DRAFT_697169 [Colletotrichum godetiae]|uniref:Enoyl reductase (ER) domain-containing protein n=1 Tax=Colletotrichum godetiae TaxID=1209918 RepID=A0AAJ0ENX1_9PEZI|nr:uncharacterized protein BDP55DRAFT_697169 [Colletotrichum godetiae]KAK1671046.1 hypothetical protein BDP55DRAFT_697169 [Colletotrichum godetiae]
MLGTALFVENLPRVTARDNEILIDVLYSRVNLADLKIVHFLNYRSSVPETDFCGQILDCSALVNSEFEVSDIVAGQTVPQGDQSKEYGSHKPRLSTPQTHSDAAAITTVSHTASDALYNNFELPLPGSSSHVVGGTLVLARTSGITNIITTASPSRHDLLRGLGATECFDYKDANVSDKVKQSVIKAGRSRVWGFETSGSPESSQLLLDALYGIAGDVQYSWVNAAGAQRPPIEAVLGTRDYEIVFEVPGDRHVIPAEPEKAANMWAALDLAVKIPVVRVFEGTGEEALEEMASVSKQGAFGKLVLKQPLQ